VIGFFSLFGPPQPEPDSPEGWGFVLPGQSATAHAHSCILKGPIEDGIDLNLEGVLTHPYFIFFPLVPNFLRHGLGLMNQRKNFIHAVRARSEFTPLLASLLLLRS